MADYVPPGVAEKRVRYFDGQFLQDQDFIDEQNYQLDREHRHNRLLHGPGIADGLTVTSTTPNQVTVAPGTAIDSDGHQLALAQATTVDLPAADFNDKQGIQLYISYLESAEDPQAVGGSQDFTRWLERPQLTAVVPGHDYAGTAPPVLLASLALDNAGRIAVDSTVRSYAGLRLPGAAADAVTLRATSGGPVDLAGSLAVDGNVGIGNPSPAYPLHLATGKVLRIEGGANASDSATYLSFGGNGAFGIDAPGAPSGRFVVQNTGRVGVGTASPGAKLEVVGDGGTSIDLVVNGRLRSNNNDGGLWVAQDRFVGGLDTNKIGFFNNNAWRLAVLNNGYVGIGTTNPGNDLEVGAFEAQDRFLAFKVAGGNAYRSGVKMWAWKDNNGFSIQYDERNQTGNGLHIKTHNQNADGATQLFVGWSGNIGIGTTTPAARFSVVAPGASEISGTAHSAVLRTSAGALGQNSGSEVALSSTGLSVGNNKVGLGVRALRTANGTDWYTSAIGLGMDVDNTVRAGAALFLHASGNVGIGATTPGAKLEVAGGGGSSVDLLVNGRLRSNNNDGGLWVAQDRFVGGLDTNKIGFYNNNAWRLAVLNNGYVGIATTNPGNDLEVGAFDDQDRFLAFKVLGGNKHRSGVKMWAWKDNNGFSIQYDERNQTGNGLHIKTHNQDPDGKTQLFVGWGGGVAIGATTTNKQALFVAGPTWLQGPLFVDGPLIYRDGAGWRVIYTRSSLGVDWAAAGPAGGPAMSDVRLKTDLRPIGRALDLVRKLRGVRYRWSDDGLAHFTRDVESSVLAGPDATDEQNHERQQAERRRALETLAGDRMGLVAQDVEAVAPELVHRDEDGYKHIRYQHLTALLAEAIKEQDAVVQALSAKVAALQARQ